MAGSSNAADAAARLEELEFNQALNANVSNFVTVKLSGRENYEIWIAQMMCLLEVYNMCGVYKYDKLLKGWVFSSIDQEVLKRVISHCSALDIFATLQCLYAPNQRTDPIMDLPMTDRMLIDLSPNENESAELMMKLLNATMEGSWWKAKAILKNHKDAATKVINNTGDTMLHIAVKEGKNYFVNQLLNFIKDGSEITIKNSLRYTALHTAVIGDNKQAAELLVNKSSELLDEPDNFGQTPLDLAYRRGKINTFLYLLGVTSYGQAWLHSDLHLGVHLLLANATSTKQYNLALKLVEIPGLLESAAKDDKALMALTTDFPPELGFWEALIYPSSHGVRQNILKISSLLLYSSEKMYIKAHDILWAIIKQKNTYLRWLLLFIALILLVPVAGFCLIYLLICIVIIVLLLPLFMLYPHLWKGLVYAGLPIKHIEKKKRDYGEAIKVLKLICNEMNKMHNRGELYGRPILEAARVDACEVVVEILSGFKDAQTCKNERGYDVFQLAILNRSEKVYNRLCPGIKHGYFRELKDSSENWLTHLAAKLASSVVLSRTTGAALQLQRELQWHEEVKKLMHPTELTHKNLDMETSDMVFTREHAKLLKDGEEWIKPLPNHAVSLLL